jgi:hypothetical protein
MVFDYLKTVLGPLGHVVIGAQKKEEGKIEYLFLFPCIRTSSFCHTCLESHSFND